jgi:nitrogen fixation NifU-like protein
VAEALEGLPKNKLHCSNLGADALQLALKDYEDRKAGKPRPEKIQGEKHEHGEKDSCYCPYCDAEVDEGETFCKSCNNALVQLK